MEILAEIYADTYELVLREVGPLIAALKARRNPILFAGIGGPRMQEQGFESHYPMEML